MKSHCLSKVLAPSILLVFAFSILVVFLSCSEETSYQIEVRNKLPVPANVSLDGMQEKSLNAGDHAYFHDVLEGTHILRAEASGFEPIEELIRVDSDIIWTIEEKQ